MAEPSLTILGVYRPRISKKAWREQWGVSADDEQTRAHFAGLVLIEAVVDGLDAPFDMGEFGQTLPVENDNDKQVGYDEGLLSSDGKKRLVRAMNCVRGDGPLRFAAYLHFYDPTRPIEWQGGTVSGPPIEDAPPRLKRLMPYRAVT